jgi:hypothetical protein
VHYWKEFKSELLKLFKEKISIKYEILKLKYYKYSNLMIYFKLNISFTIGKYGTCPRQL